MVRRRVRTPRYSREASARLPGAPWTRWPGCVRCRRSRCDRQRTRSCKAGIAGPAGAQSSALHRQPPPTGRSSFVRDDALLARAPRERSSRLPPHFTRDALLHGGSTRPSPRSYAIPTVPGSRAGPLSRSAGCSLSLLPGFCLPITSFRARRCSRCRRERLWPSRPSSVTPCAASPCIADSTSREFTDSVRAVRAVIHDPKRGHGCLLDPAVIRFGPRCTTVVGRIAAGWALVIFDRAAAPGHRTVTARYPLVSGLGRWGDIDTLRRPAGTERGNVVGVPSSRPWLQSVTSDREAAELARRSQ